MKCLQEKKKLLLLVLLEVWEELALEKKGMIQVKEVNREFETSMEQIKNYRIYKRKIGNNAE